ncbi:hypothetical protein M9Y10_030642 [Tritrichomonas musculus]|uniref:Right handed beta helix domain-containing protein n=1 Tax=Tritrichomonas musculus TaxID=1915356 RepID=A0ABR2H4C9_9EUKA
MLLLLLSLFRFSYQAEIPDPTRRVTPTPEETRTPIPGGSDKYINKVIEIDIDETDKQIQINDQSAIKQISGCTFRNIGVDKNFFIKVDKEIPFFNNVIENDELVSGRPSVMWVSNNIKFVLSRCKFVKCVGRSSDGNILTANTNHQVHITFEFCEFIDCSNDPNKALVNFLDKAGSDEESSANFTECIFRFNDSNKGCRVLDSVGEAAVFDRCEFFQSGPYTINISDTKAQSTTTSSFQFTNNLVTKMKGRLIHIETTETKLQINGNTFDQITISEGHFIQINHKLDELTIQNNAFSRMTNTGDSNSGGFATLIHKKVGNDYQAFKLKYDNCSFTDISNSKSSLAHGGAVQFGFASNLDTLSVSLTNCVFKMNKASQHGGAVAIQTKGSISIVNCIFEENKANNKVGSLNLLEKKEGLGGAIFLNPIFAEGSSEKVSIEGCTFKSNIAYDGYAIYIEGTDEGSTAYTIKNNKFFNNYNGGSSSTGGAIVSEITKISKKEVEDSNEFSNTEHGSQSKKFIHADHNGSPLPDPTATPRATPEETRTPIPGGSDKYINKVIEIDIDETNKQIQINDQSAIKQISGCTFRNIGVDKNFFIKVDKEIPFFNNVIENDELVSGRPSVMWVSNNIKFVLSRCKFVKCVGRSSDGNILTANTNHQVHITFEFCEFIDCSNDPNKALVNFLDKAGSDEESSANFTECIFRFNDSNKGCRVLDSVGEAAVFDRCEFFQSGPYTINISDTKAQSTGTFQFTKNTVTKNGGKLIHLGNSKVAYKIEDNTFSDIAISDGYFIHIVHDQDELNLIRNTFSQFKTSASTECGGIAVYFERTNDKQFHIKYDNCNFFDITSANAASNGGAVAFTKTVSVTLASCLFRKNTAHKHGGAVSLKTSGNIVIQSCTFEDNKASSSSSSSSSLLAEKAQCRGGAIFLTQVSGSSSSVKIDDCTFKTNTAHDAYAIYIERESTESTATNTYTITNNKFINNYNGDSTSSCTGSIIASEVTTITKEDIEKSNVFEASIYGQGCAHFYHVDGKGDKLPNPTAKPDPSNPGSNVIEWGDSSQPEVDVSDNRCHIVKDPNVEADKNIAVQIVATKFTNMKNEEGGAIHLENCGLLCTNECQFIECNSPQGGGGAIYINNPTNMINTVKLQGLKFSSCTAPFGGAVFIKSVAEINVVTIISCTFTGNKATATQGNFGGSALYLCVKNGVVSYCTFDSNKGPGGSVKVVNDFEQQSAKLFSKKQAQLLLSECTFKINKDLSSSVFYVRGREGPKFIISKCMFTGKVSQNAHHIDGVVLEKTAPLLFVKDCKFAGSAMNAIDVNKGFSSIDLHNQVFEYEEKEKSASKLWMVGALAALAVLAVVAVTTSAIKSLRQNNNDTNQEENGISEECL